MKLLDCKEDNVYIVESLEQTDKDALNKISAMGILPGTEVILLQKKPMLVFQVYNSRFAIDDYLGGMINVRTI
ncbi:MAG: ferrous iron transport protein A [Deferribacterales bacterium]